MCILWTYNTQETAQLELVSILIKFYNPTESSQFNAKNHGFKR